ncbi:uncharacterized protein LY89DRAFT_727551 [Mollisia scopiformis]|uniref:2EXR domain-containing protein n=1 Tax=Mollisia scopiformis TaxID=149040 RepID=A0A194XXI8_MOLSC|nr:uncharacterized protein LY89DRAFT_727551 [Mollisia scopiformis]KUJ24527.1 hypothetical protein LY89DRAFT_727551 [Mollisia scopiformis]
MFSKFGPEIRCRIWHFSLPGPRALCPGVRSTPSGEYETNRDYRKLFFPGKHQAPNPAALSVCRESRQIALQWYRLCFGTQNIYADLNIDILFFGPWDVTDFGTFWEWDEYKSGGPGGLTNIIHKTLQPEVAADLKKVQRLAYRYLDGWAEYDDTHGEETHMNGGGDELRKQLGRFESLKEVLLSHGPDNTDDLRNTRRRRWVSNMLSQRMKVKILIHTTFSPNSERKTSSLPSERRTFLQRSRHEVSQKLSLLSNVFPMYQNMLIRDPTPG